MRNRTIFFTVLLAVTIFFSCGNISDKKIRIAYANWAEGIAVTYPVSYTHLTLPTT